MGGQDVDHSCGTTHNQRVVHVLVLQSLQTRGVDVDVILL